MNAEASDESGPAAGTRTGTGHPARDARRPARDAGRSAGNTRSVRDAGQPAATEFASAEGRRKGAEPASSAEPASNRGRSRDVESPAASAGDRTPAAGEAGQAAETAPGAAGPGGRPQRASRRFPLLTHDTARPEGGGRAASGDAPAPARQWPMLAVLAVVGIGLLLTAFDAFRIGTMVIGVALIAGAVMRWTLPSVGMLAVRSRFTDMITYGVLGVAIVLLAMMVQPSPWLKIPFLDDALHFTIS